MRKLSNFVVEFLKREDGPTAVEYAVMLALSIVVCIGAITTLGKNANGTFTSVGPPLGLDEPSSGSFTGPRTHLATPKPCLSGLGRRLHLCTCPGGSPGWASR